MIGVNRNFGNVDQIRAVGSTNVTEIRTEYSNHVFIARHIHPKV